MELEEWTKIKVDFGYPKNAANESHMLSMLEKIEAEATVSSNKIGLKNHKQTEFCLILNINIS